MIFKYIEFQTPNISIVREGKIKGPDSNEVLISVCHAGVNRADLLQRMGVYPPPVDASPIPGLEVAGVITSVGSNIQDWQCGDRVCALTQGGGYASMVLARGDHCLALPDSLSTREGAALPEAILTIWYNIFERAHLKPGETVLIHGGSSGIGSIGIQMANFWNATVVSSAGSPERCQAVKGLGADYVANHRLGDLYAQYEEAGYAGKIDVILDIAGGDLTQTNLDLAALDGRIACIGIMRGAKANINLATVFTKRLTLTGSTLRKLSSNQRAACFAEIKAKIWPQVISKNITPIVDTIFPMKNVMAAHEHMHSGGHFGKLLLDCQGL